MKRIICLIFALAVCCVTALASTITVTPTVQGNVATYTVTAKEVANLSGFQLTLGYDSTQLSAANVTQGNVSGLFYSNTDNAGEVKTIWASNATVTGSETLFTVSFTLADGVTKAPNLTLSGDLVDADTNEINYTISGSASAPATAGKTDKTADGETADGETADGETADKTSDAVAEAEFEGAEDGASQTDQTAETSEKSTAATEESSQAMKFTDVKPGDWFYDSVEYVYQKGMMDGVSKTAFDPEGTAQRAMLVTVLWRLNGSPTGSKTPTFTDLSQDWYREAVAWSAEKGIVTGYNNETFAPADPLTREMLVTILYRYAKSVLGLDVSAKGDLSQFSDTDEISSYATDAIRWAVGAGLLKGSGGKLSPKGTSTRAQLAALLQRFMTAAEI